jgi:hypothetical protein
MWVARNAYIILFGKSEGKRPLGKCHCRGNDNIKADIIETMVEVMDWMYLFWITGSHNGD